MEDRFHDSRGFTHRIIAKMQDQLLQPLATLQELLHPYGQEIQSCRLFQSTMPHKVDALQDAAAAMGYYGPNLNSYMAIDIADDGLLLPLQVRLQQCGAVEHFFLEQLPPPPPAVFTESSERFCPGYLQEAPTGIDALFAWDYQGGKGSGIKLVDIEQGWSVSDTGMHFTEAENCGGNLEMFQEHGAAVLATLLLPENRQGGSGIVPEATASVVSQWRPDGSFNTADALLVALSQLRYGDILLVQAQLTEAAGSHRFWPVEIQPPVFNCIRLATALGITVIEAAGNGGWDGVGNNLDNFHWQEKKILDPLHGDFRDSGAVMVAAATCRIPHRRMPFSNFGRRIDCFAWGEKVNPFHNYSIGLNGTSSASAMVAGAAVSLQGIAAAETGKLLPPTQLRSLLRSKSLNTLAEESNCIGLMPDLKKLVLAVCGHNKKTEPSFHQNPVVC